jgi:hypothetical protein
VSDPPRVLVADDHPALRLGMKAVIKSMKGEARTATTPKGVARSHDGRAAAAFVRCLGSVVTIVKLPASPLRHGAASECALTFELAVARAVTYRREKP